MFTSFVPRDAVVAAVIGIFLFSPCTAAAIEGAWTDLNPDSPTRITSANLEGVDFASATRGVIVGASGTILRTDNSGDTWVSMNSGTVVSLRDVAFPHEDHAIALGDGGVILRSDDGGFTWSSQSSGTTEDLLAVHFSDVQTGTAVGANATILRTTDGVNWSPQVIVKDADFQTVYFLDSQNGFIGGSNGILLRTTSGGGYWYTESEAVRCYDHHGLTMCNAFSDVYFLNASTGFVVGSPADPAYAVGGSIFKTSSGGTTWSIPAQPSEYDFFVALAFLNETDGLLFTTGLQPTVHCTTDAGATWAAAQAPLLPGGINAATRGNADTAYAVGDNGTILRWSRSQPTPIRHTTMGGLKSLFGD